MRGTVYILQDDTGRFYIGSTNNLKRRIKQHHYRHTQTTTRMKNPTLVFQQEFDNIEKARIIEMRLKKLKRKDYLQNIIKDGYIKIANKI